MRLGWLLAKRYPGRSMPDGQESGDPRNIETLDVSDVRSLGFWISNALTIVATALTAIRAKMAELRSRLESSASNPDQ